jgi:hypothetical protein
MPKTSFFVSLTTEGYNVDMYTEQAGMMANVFTDIFGDTAKIAVLTKNASITSCHSEVDVMQSDGKLVGRALVEFEAETRVAINKTKLSQMLRSAAPWDNCKVEKRAVETDVLEQASHAMTLNTAVVA